MPPNLLVGPTVATLMATGISQDEATSIIYMDTVTASIGLIALGTSCMVVDPGMPILEDVTDVINQ